MQEALVAPEQTEEVPSNVLPPQHYPRCVEFLINLIRESNSMLDDEEGEFSEISSRLSFIVKQIVPRSDQSNGLVAVDVFMDEPDEDGENWTARLVAGGFWGPMNASHRAEPTSMVRVELDSGKEFNIVADPYVLLALLLF